MVSSAAVSTLAKNLTVKLVAKRGTGRLLGGQAVGRVGADSAWKSSSV